MLRVSTTTVEQFRRMLVYDYVSETEMVSKIRGEQIPSKWQIDVGKAWHTILEEFAQIKWAEQVSLMMGMDTEKHPSYIIKDIYLFFERDVREARSRIGHCLWEVKGNRIFETPYGQCNVIAKADNVYGNLIQDTKCKFTSLPDGKDWESDLQWRMYLLVHEAERFRYNAFRFKEPVPSETMEHLFEVRPIDFISFNFFRYSDMEKDCLLWLNQFLDWANEKNLLPFLHREGSD